MEKNIVGLAGEYAVASELCRRNIYAQLTFGNRKRTDILVESEKEFLRIEVKAKQGNEWPGCKGIYGEESILIFVDFKGKKESDRPDFYILSTEDWLELLHSRLGNSLKKGEIILDDYNVPHYISKKVDGKEYLGTGIKSQDVSKYKENWDKIISRLKLIDNI